MARKVRGRNPKRAKEQSHRVEGTGRTNLATLRVQKNRRMEQKIGLLESCERFGFGCIFGFFLGGISFYEFTFELEPVWSLLIRILNSADGIQYNKYPHYNPTTFPLPPD